MSASDAITLEPFFASGAQGRIFCLSFAPGQGSPCRGGVLLVPPFAEELNKSRRQLALQARALAAAGYQVLLMDLFGTGDSEGDFADATWDGWLGDLEAAAQQLQSRCPPLTIIGLRLGALLAADLARRLPQPPSRLVFWQPVVSGRQHVDQFLRLRMAASLIGAKEGDGVTVRGLRDLLAGGSAIEVAGYELRPALVRGIDAGELARLAPPTGTRVDWLEVSSTEGRGLALPSERVVASYRAAAVDVRTEVVVGDPFWSTVEIVVAPALIERTTALVAADA